MGKHKIFLIHGMGEHDAGWSKPLTDIIVEQYKKHHIDIGRGDILVRGSVRNEWGEAVWDWARHDYDVYFEIKLDKEENPGLDYMKETLSYFMPTANIYEVKMPMDYMRPGYTLALNFDQTYNDPTYKSHIGITKYKI